jgi:hypothetical protein
MSAAWLDIKDAPRDGTWIVVSLKKRMWYDGPSVVRWEPDFDGGCWWLPEGCPFKDEAIAGWCPIAQADH